MKRLASILILATLGPSNALWAQLPPPNTAGVSMGHIHLNVRDVESHKKFWSALGGTPVKLGPLEVVKFPDVLVFLQQAQSSGGTVGTVVNHVAFRVPNVQEALARWKDAGLNTLPGRNPQTGFVVPPDELRLEILEDPSLSIPIAYHHIHFHVADTGESDSVAEIKAWYVKMFGAEPGMRGQNQAADVPGVNLTFSKASTETVVGTKGRVLDHIGFEVKGLEAFCKKLEANGTKFDVPYTKRPDLGIGVAFLTDPWGTYIELTEGLNRL
ncbi:MAG: VOC family protein [Acidobacteria bacterium]|nr:VOC family protein [Acidobacteriota bacterium]